jgi:hypothetical protein
LAENTVKATDKVTEKSELQAVADEQTRSDFGFVVAPKKTVLLFCSVCHNTDTVEGVLGRQHYPGSCGHCGGAFRVIEK